MLQFKNVWRKVRLNQEHPEVAEVSLSKHVLRCLAVQEPGVLPAVLGTGVLTATTPGEKKYSFVLLEGVLKLPVLS